MSLWVACDHRLGWTHIPERVSLHFSNWNLYFNQLVQIFRATAMALKQALGVKHLENDLNPIHSQPLFTCHKESLTMILLHIESQFSDKEKISYTHLVKKYWDFRNSQLTCGLSFFSLFFSLHPLWKMNIWPCYLICPPSVSYHTHDVNSEPIHKDQPALLKSAIWGQAGGWGNKLIMSFPSSSHSISFPAVTWPK